MAAIRGEETPLKIRKIFSAFFLHVQPTKNVKLFKLRNGEKRSQTYVFPSNRLNSGPSMLKAAFDENLNFAKSATCTDNSLEKKLDTFKLLFWKMAPCCNVK